MLEANTMLITKLKQKPNEDARQSLIANYLNSNYHIVERYTDADRLGILSDLEVKTYDTQYWRDVEDDQTETTDYAILAANDSSTIKAGFADFESARNYLLKETGLLFYWNMK